MTLDKMQSIPGKVRLKDVAAAAGVSVSTASRVLSGAKHTSARTAAAVIAASEQLKYRPDPIARALRAQATGLIGMVVPSVGNPFFAEMVEAVERALHELGLELMIADSGDTPDDEARRLQVFAHRKVDGLLVIPAHHDASASALRQIHSLPIVLLDRQVDGFPSDYVGVDNALGIAMILDHLEAQGYRRLVFVSDAAASSTGRSRLEAFEHQTKQRPMLVIDEPRLGAFSIEFGCTVAHELLTNQHPPDAIVCGSDLIALGVVRELHRAGISIPHDIGVTGFDGILFADLCDPPLTTVRQPITAIADEAVRLLASRIARSDSRPCRTEVAPVLEIRGSSRRQGSRAAGDAIDHHANSLGAAFAAVRSSSQRAHS